MSTINETGTIPSLEGKTVDVEILPLEFSTTGFGAPISDTVEKVLLSALKNIAATSREKLDRVSTISIKTRYRFEVVPEDSEISISLKS
ncbi:hypothetical protein JMF94_13805 [Desulfovibrio sp. UIB00]|uniref:hypothetical protein n=1 Tax=Desulfovibrio sp. UIB00 TaxID=2804314 RepID=UPI001F1127F7|nr:hypothetical protein [Desulfovibrio sp. UIB00]MCH5146154.1 hypothetical protein [Desulfovibrio sp. UIB00]